MRQTGWTAGVLAVALSCLLGLAEAGAQEIREVTGASAQVRVDAIEGRWSHYKECRQESYNDIVCGASLKWDGRTGYDYNMDSLDPARLVIEKVYTHGMFLVRRYGNASNPVEGYAWYQFVQRTGADLIHVWPTKPGTMQIDRARASSMGPMTYRETYDQDRGFIDMHEYRRRRAEAEGSTVGCVILRGADVVALQRGDVVSYIPAEELSAELQLKGRFLQAHRVLNICPYDIICDVSVEQYAAHHVDRRRSVSARQDIRLKSYDGIGHIYKNVSEIHSCRKNPAP